MNIKDIARLSKVSASTVSKIVNSKDDSISSETRERVLSVIRQYHYTPYAKISSQSKTWHIAVILRSSISFDTTLDGIIQTAQQSGYGTVVFNSYSNIEQESKNISALSKHKIDGVIWEPVSKESFNKLKGIEHEIPWLTIGSIGGDESLLLPYSDAAYKLTEQLISHGHTSIGCLMTDGRRTKDFLNGFKSCLFDHHLDFDESRIFFDLNDKLVEKISDHSITALVSSHYRKALEFQQLMTSLNRSIPEDVSLVSIKNDTNKQPILAKNSEISTYTIRNADFGSYLCSKLIDEIEKRHESKTSFVQEFHLDNTRTIGSPSQLRKQKITIIGSINLDTCLSVQNLPSKNESINVQTSKTYPNGSAINQAIAVSNLGQRVTLIGNVGYDLDADKIYKTLSQWAIDSSGVIRKHESHTGKAYTLVDACGDSITSVISGANSTLNQSNIQDRANLFENTAYCIIQSDIPVDAIISACKIAKKAGAKIIFNHVSSENIPKEIIDKIDILFTNIDSKSTDRIEEIAKEKSSSFINKGVKTVIINMLHKGYLLSDYKEEKIVKSNEPNIEKYSNCSDAFVSALAAYMLYGYTTNQAAEIAAYAANYSNSREEITPSFIDKYTLETSITMPKSSLINQ